ncbi:conjugal transfer protein [Bacteroidia bacterium]|nr:conjugal transfer protein [Bacteroidia bacterium]GHU13534.1 conjugal transfer protein [Betaproteobacteria bacterium]
MKNKKLTAIGDWIDDRLRYACGSITPDMRFVITVAMLLLFAAGSLYFTVSSIYHIGKSKGEQIQIEQIRRIEFDLQQQETDSIKQLKRF